MALQNIDFIIVGAVVGGGFDLVETKVIADRAYRWFIEGEFEEDEEIIDVDTEADKVEKKNSVIKGISQMANVVKEKDPVGFIKSKNPFLKG